jgi:hypothetical protein
MPQHQNSEAPWPLRWQTLAPWIQGLLEQTAHLIHFWGLTKSGVLGLASACAIGTWNLVLVAWFLHAIWGAIHFGRPRIAWDCEALGGCEEWIVKQMQREHQMSWEWRERGERGWMPEAMDEWKFWCGSNTLPTSERGCASNGHFTNIF